ncbi:MAG: CDP-diacylglycerol--glycerol-3-phosphate 3-phosphatidyltransferase [Pirellulales bacterium]
MSVSTKTRERPAVFNLPNQLTVSRLVLALVLVGLMAFELYLASLLVFLLAASTDWLDGYFARKYGMITTLGRILDPFVDKIIICGVFISLVADPQSGVQAWMAVLIVGRELLITALRSFLEQQGSDFSASLSGKLKMIFQCIAAGLSLFYLSLASKPPELWYLLLASIWAAVILTVYSGVSYVRTALVLLRQ